MTDVDEASEDLEDYDFVTLNYISEETDPFHTSSNDFKSSTINVLTSLEVLEDNSTFKIKHSVDEMGDITLAQDETLLKTKEHTDSATLLAEENSPTISSDQESQIVFNETSSSENSEDNKLATFVVTEGFTSFDLISDNTTGFNQYLDETSQTELEELTEAAVVTTETSTPESGTTESTAETEWFEDYLY